MVSKGVLKWSQKLGQLSKSLFGARATLVGKDALGNAYYKKMEYDPDLGKQARERERERRRAGSMKKRCLNERSHTHKA